MLRLIFSIASALAGLSIAYGQTAALTDSNALEQKIQKELSGPYPSESPPDSTIPHGNYLSGSVDSASYPGTQAFQVYVPAQYDPAKPACLLVRLDGFGPKEGAVLDDLIAKKEVPVMIGVGIGPGSLVHFPPGHPEHGVVRYNRSFEFDSVNDRFSNFVVNDLLPAVEKLTTPDGRAIHLSTDGNDRAVTGMSTGGIGAFTLAWNRPDQFTRVYAAIGTFVSMRGGNAYPALIRKTDPKPIRIFLEDGSGDSWNPLFGSWYDGNRDMELALSFAGYDVGHAWGTHGHDGGPGTAIFPDVMRWLWRDYPAPIQAGVSQNSTLQEIEVPGEGWRKIPRQFPSVAGLATNLKGEVYLSDASTGGYHLEAGDKPILFAHESGIVGQAFGPDGTLYSVVPGEKKIVAIAPQGTSRTIADGIAGRGIIVTHDGTLYVTEPGAHSDMPSQIWQIKPDGGKKLLDDGLQSSSGIAFSPDGMFLYVAENTTQWIYSYAVQPDGTLAGKQPYYWLHMTDVPNDSGAEDLAIDTNGNLYVATRMGIQVCDQNGRVRAILPLPTPCGPVRSLCFGGEKFDILYVTDGVQIFKRKLKVPGFAPWALPTAYPNQGAS